MKLYWLSIVEEQGRLFIFGAQSRCLVIVGMERRIYFLPRINNRSVDWDCLREEVGRLLLGSGVKDFTSKITTKLDAFHLSQASSEYLEINYPAVYDPLPAGLSGDTFSSVFGVKTPLTELFLLEVGLKGPCWLEVDAAAQSRFTRCKHEATVEGIKHIKTRDLPPPTVVLLSIDIQVRGEELVAASGIVSPAFPLDKQHTESVYDVEFSAATTSSAFNEIPRLTKLPCERALLSYLSAKIKAIDPDIISGFGIVSDGLFDRMIKHGLASSLGRIRLPGSAFMTRVLCDTKLSAKQTVKCVSYAFPDLVECLLGRRRKWDAESALLEYSREGAALSLDLMRELNVLPLALQISHITGTVLGRTLVGGISERIENLLLHAFHSNNYICPEPTKKPVDKSFPGGLVLEPKVGFYDTYLILLDFASLYPSIILEYDVCFARDKKVLPLEIKKLIECRRLVKALMNGASPERRFQYDCRQLALKLVTNAVYGCIGNSYFRFSNREMAAFITSKGRETLLKTKELLEGTELKILYGNTDSILIQTSYSDYETSLDLAKKLKSRIDSLYKHMTIEIECLFRPFILLGKNRYAGIVIVRDPGGSLVTKREVKGLEIVRRDFPIVAKRVSGFIINAILSGVGRKEIPTAIVSYMSDVRERLMNNQFPVTDFVIVKQLGKSVGEYVHAEHLPHVQVATRGKLYKGDSVKYVIVEGEKACTVEEFNGGGLKIDTLFYINRYIIPAVSRFCDHIEGLDSGKVAECFGVRNKHKKLCCRDSLTCPKCGATLILNGGGACACEYTPSDIHGLTIQLDGIIRGYFKKLDESVFQCEHFECSFRMTTPPRNLVCPACSNGLMLREYSEKDLYEQVSSFYRLFESGRETLHGALKETTNNWLEKLPYSKVDLKALFAGLETGS